MALGTLVSLRHVQCLFSDRCLQEIPAKNHLLHQVRRQMWERFSTHWLDKKLFKMTAADIPVISTVKVEEKLETTMAVLCFVNFLSLMLPKCLRKCEFCCTAVTGRGGASAIGWYPGCSWCQCFVYSASSYTLSKCWICNMNVIIKLCLN